jgi:hypothetical protein
MADIRASSSNNTTPLGAGEGTSFTARDFRDANAKMISQTIARENYRSNALSGSKLSELRKYVFKMVNGWSNETKMRIISEYGDSSQLRSANPEEVNRQVTETLIINLKPEDAEILLRDIRVKEKKLYRDVEQINRSRVQLSEKYRRLSRFSAKTMDEVAGDLRYTSRIGKLRRQLRRYDPTFSIPKRVLSQFKNLQRELINVLKELYNRVEINNLALRMDIEVPDRITERQLRNSIINKTLLYVSLIVGKTKRGFSNAFLAVQPFEEILRYTSYSYVTGKPPISDDEIREKMRIAAKAKAIFDAKKRPELAGLAGLKKREKDKESYSTVEATPVPTKDETKLTKEKQEYVESLIEGRIKIKELQAKRDLLGKARGPRNIIEKVFGTKQSRTQSRLEKAISENNKTVDVGLRLKEREELLRKRKELKDQKAQEMGKEIPYVGVSDTGITNKDITKAVPVYVINEWMKQRLEKAEGTKAKNEELKSLKKDYKKSGIFGMFKNKKLKDQITELEYEKMQSLDEEIGVESVSDKFWDRMTINIGREEEITRLKANQAVRVYDMSGERRDRDLLKISEKNDLVEISSEAKKFKATTLRAGLVTPVYLVNKNMTVETGLEDILSKIPGIGKLVDIAKADTVGEAVKAVIGAATGGVGRYVGGRSKTSQFISGDSMNKSPNPEKVLINWDNKSYSVKPIPKFATGGDQRATSGQFTRMTAGERSAPMSVGISSHTVTYNRSLSKDVNDNGSKEALKVYAVNPGISDLLEVNGKSVSAIGLMADMSDRLGRIEGLLAVGNEQRRAVVASTAATASLVQKRSSGSNGSNPFTGGFPSELDSILKGM